VRLGILVCAGSSLSCVLANKSRYVWVTRLAHTLHFCVQQKTVVNLVHT
jgi:hypothetical protein